MNERSAQRIWKAIYLTSTVCILCSHGGSSQAETSVGGKISGRTSWTREASPYVTTANIEVPAGSILTIEPGVDIRLSGHSIIVRGTLLAKGTTEAPICFTSQNLESPAAQDWGLMTFEGQSSGATYDQAQEYLSGSILEHVIVEYGHGLFFNAGAPLVSHCTIRHHRKKRGGGIYAHGCTPVIRDSVISYNVANEEGGGIRTAYCQPVLVGNTITHNSARYDGGGVSIDYSAARIEENTISYNFASHAGGISTGETQVGQTSVSGQSHSKPHILRNRITNNTAVFSGGGVFIQGTPVITDNTIAGNRIHHTMHQKQPTNSARIERKTGAGAGIKVTDTYGGPLTIEGNVIAGNRGAFWGAGMCFDRAGGTVEANRIVGNQAILHGGAVSILVRSSQKSFVGREHGAQWTFEENDIRANSGGVFELAMARFGGQQSIFVARCNLAGNEGKTFVNFTKNNVVAAANWWGTKDSKAIGELIEDFFDNSQYGQIRFEPVGEPRAIEGLPEVTGADLAFLVAYPERVRAGQGFNRLPGTPPSVTIVWNAGKLKDVAGYRVHFSRIEPRFDNLDPIDDIRIPTKCHDGVSPVDVGNVLRTVLSGFTIGHTYEFFVTAYDAHGRESAMSDPFVVEVRR